MNLKALKLHLVQKLKDSLLQQLEIDSSKSSSIFLFSFWMGRSGKLCDDIFNRKAIAAVVMKSIFIYHWRMPESNRKSEFMLPLDIHPLTIHHFSPCDCHILSDVFLTLLHVRFHISPHSTSSWIINLLSSIQHFISLHDFFMRVLTPDKNKNEWIEGNTFSCSIFNSFTKRFVFIFYFINQWIIWAEISDWKRKFFIIKFSRCIEFSSSTN